MLASELISVLESLQAAYGDREVVREVSDARYASYFAPCKGVQAVDSKRYAGMPVVEAREHKDRPDLFKLDF